MWAREKLHEDIFLSINTGDEPVRVQITLYKGKDYCHNPGELPSSTPFYRVMLC